MELTLDPIAIVVGGRTEVADDYWGGARSIIRLNEELPESTVLGLEEFSHGSAEDVHLGARRPRGNPDWPETGTFVHRNHRRPARIAISHPRLLRLEGRDLHVEDLDAVDGTPIYDLAPWFVEFGPRGEVRQPAWPAQMLAEYWAPQPEPHART